MDIRRVRIKENKNATVLSNDLVRAVIQDHNGRLIEFSSMNIHGGWVNCNRLHKFPFSKDTVLQEGFSYDHSSSLENQLYGCQLHVELKDQLEYLENEDENDDNKESDIKDVPASELGNVILDREAKSKKEKKVAFLDAVFEKKRINWVVQRYGSDETTGGVWVLSKNITFGKGSLCQTRRLDLVLPHQPVVYSAIYIKNTDKKDLNIDLGFDNTLGSPFLESGCIINSSASSWKVSNLGNEECSNTRIKNLGKPFPLDKAPIEKGGNCDARYIPGVLGTTDVLFSDNDDKDSSHVWLSVINPKQQMVYISFTPSKHLLEDIDISLDYSTIVMDFGGRSVQPWSLYEGGTCNEFSLHLGSRTSCLGEKSEITLKPGEVRRVMYARALHTYDNTRLGNNFYTFESFNHNIVLKRTKSSIVIPSDPKFEIVKKFCDKLINFDVLKANN